MKLFQSLNKPLISICIPCRDTIHTAFASDLLSLLQQSFSASYDVNFLMLQGSLISAQRQKLAELALEQNSDYIMWLDSDMGYPVDIIDSLLAHKKDIVACNYSTRITPYKGVAYKTIGNWHSWIDNNNKNKLDTVEGVGMGCMLVNTAVFKTLPKPWFEIFYSDQYQTHLGEDFYFCIKAREYKYDIWIDLESSKQIKHFGTSEFTSKLWENKTK